MNKKDELISLVILGCHFVTEIWNMIKFEVAGNYYTLYNFVNFLVKWDPMIQDHELVNVEQLQKSKKLVVRYFARILNVIFCKILELWDYKEVKKKLVKKGINVWPGDLPLMVGEDFPENPSYAEPYK
jgi:hypothetical protein